MHDVNARVCQKLSVSFYCDVSFILDDQYTFLSVTWLPCGQLWAVSEETASPALC